MLNHMSSYDLSHVEQLHADIYHNSTSVGVCPVHCLEFPLLWIWKACIRMSDD